MAGARLSPWEVTATGCRLQPQWLPSVGLLRVKEDLPGRLQQESGWGPGASEGPQRGTLWTKKSKHGGRFEGSEPFGQGSA